MKRLLLGLVMVLIAGMTEAGGWPVTPGAMYQDWSFTFVTESGRHVRHVLSQDSSGWDQKLNREFFNQAEVYCAGVEGEPCVLVTMVPLLPMDLRDKEACEHYWTPDCPGE